MEFLRVRKIEIDVPPGKEPFIAVYTDKVISDETGEHIIQTIGGYDRIYRKLSDVPSLPLDGIADDGIIAATETYALIAKIAYSWLMEKHNGVMVGNFLVVG